jgi:hypothetical protein
MYIFLLCLVLWAIPHVFARDNPNTITFDNKSGETALVKVIGPSGQTVEVPNRQSRTVNIEAGEYYILVRYGSNPKEYSYAKGNPFTITQTATQYSATTITLHKVLDGNYLTHPISAEEFSNINVSTISDEKKGSNSSNEIYKFLARPFLIIEAQNQECNFKPPFQYGGPIFRNSFSKSVTQIIALPLRSFKIGLVQISPDINVTSSNPDFGIWIFDSSCGPIVLGKAKVIKGKNEYLITDPPNTKESDIIDLIKSENPVKKATGIWLLTQKGDTKYLEILLNNLNDMDPLVKLYTVYGIGILGRGRTDLIPKLDELSLPISPNDFLNEEIATTLKHTLHLLSSKN